MTGLVDALAIGAGVGHRYDFGNRADLCSFRGAGGTSASMTFDRRFPVQ